MEQWRPLSKHGQSDERLDEPTEGLPPFLAGPLATWLEAMFCNTYRGTISRQRLEFLQLKFKLEPARSI
jgi:hypothetical protein